MGGKVLVLGAILAMSVPAAAFVFPGVMTARANLGMTKSSAHKTAADERAAAVRKERRQLLMRTGCISGTCNTVFHKKYSL